MSDLKLRVRYFQDSTPADIVCRESEFIRRQIQMSLPLEKTALVLVDVWNIHFIESWIERASKITLEAIVPALEAARDAGLAIIHAPCSEVARQYPQHLPNIAPSPNPPLTDPDWPPAVFRAAKENMPPTWGRGTSLQAFISIGIKLSHSS